MSALKVTTDHRLRPLQMWLNLPEKFRKGEGEGYLGVMTRGGSHFEDRFVQGYGTYWDTHTDFARIIIGDGPGFGHHVLADSPLAQWHGIATIGAFAGCLIRYPEEYGEQLEVILGWAAELS